jgi:hypothetical protein
VSPHVTSKVKAGFGASTTHSHKRLERAIETNYLETHNKQKGFNLPQ